MGYNVVFSGEFVGVSGVVWRADIERDTGGVKVKPKPLTFDADRPCVIEWQHQPKEAVICGSSATLRIISPGDRSYIDFYTVDPQAVRLCVYRDGVLYWSGFLDPEFYEEPYESLKNYTVSLSFSDFGVLSRLKFLPFEGFTSIRDLLISCLAYGGISSDRLNFSAPRIISTTVPGMAADLLSAVHVRGDNFVDEHGESSNLADVIEGVLQPLGVRMVQSWGVITFYDLNGLYHYGKTSQIVWSGDRQTLGVDSVYNNVKITWSPYSQTDKYLPEGVWADDISTPDDVYSVDGEVIGYGKPYGDARYRSYYDSPSPWVAPIGGEVGFTLWTSERGKNYTLGTVNPEVNPFGLRFYKIVPQFNGQPSEGVLVDFPRIGKFLSEDVFFSSLMPLLHSDVSSRKRPLFSAPPVWIPPVARSSWHIRYRLSLDMLLDPLQNPFAGTDDLPGGLKEKYEKIKIDGNFVFVPVVVTFRDGEHTWYWNNYEVVTNTTVPIRSVEHSSGEWVPYSTGNESPGVSWLAYYDPGDRDEGVGVLGWQTNRHAINVHKEELDKTLATLDSGQYLPPLPSGNGGYLSVSVMAESWKIYDTDSNRKWWDGRNRWYDMTPKEIGMLDSWYGWLLFKSPRLDIVPYPKYFNIGGKDIEFSGVLNPNAKEALEIDTVCGSAGSRAPLGRGVYFFDPVYGYKFAERFVRASRSGSAEELLIGTLYSQYAERHTVLSGEALLPSKPSEVYTEANQDGKKFIVSEEVQDLRTGTRDAVFTELSPDEYSKK